MGIPAWVKTEAKSMAVYLVILFVAIELINAKAASIKQSVNAYGRVVCLTKKTTALHSKYDNLVNALAAQQLTAERLNMAKHDIAKAVQDARFAAQYKADLVPKSSPDCSKPILP